MNFYDTKVKKKVVQFFKSKQEEQMAIDFLMKSENFNLLAILVKFETILHNIQQSVDKNSGLSKMQERMIINLLKFFFIKLFKITSNQKSFSRPIIFVDMISGSNDYYKSQNIFKTTLQEPVLEPYLKQIRQGHGALYDQLLDQNNLNIISPYEVDSDIIQFFTTQLNQQTKDRNIKLITNLNIISNKTKNLSQFLEKIGSEYILFFDHIQDTHIKPSVLLLIKNSFQKIDSEVYQKFEKEYDTFRIANENLQLNTIIICLYLSMPKQFSAITKSLKIDPNRKSQIVQNSVDNRQTVSKSKPTTTIYDSFRKQTINVINESVDFMELWQLYVQVYFYNNKI